VATLAQRQHLHALMGYLLAHKQAVHYPPHDVRTHRASEIQTEAELHERIVAGTFEYDCSQTVEILCVVVGLHWPRALVNGYTGTLLAGLPQYTNPRNAMVGALCVVGPGTGEHVWMVAGAGADPLLWGNGSEAGPNEIRYSAEGRRPRTFLSIAAL
jgi:hypothetical protein